MDFTRVKTHTEYRHEFIVVPSFRVKALDGAGWSGDGGDVGRGRTGFDLGNAPEAACRGWFVGLVKNRTKNQKLIKN